MNPKKKKCHDEQKENINQPQALEVAKIPENSNNDVRSVVTNQLQQAHNLFQNANFNNCNFNFTLPNN